jgi:hypothetical protein
MQESEENTPKRPTYVLNGGNFKLDKVQKLNSYVSVTPVKIY